MDESIDNFMAFTGTESPDVARRYLSLTENNLEQAIQLFYDSPELATGTQEPEVPAHTVPATTRPQTHGVHTAGDDPSRPVQIESDDGDLPMDEDEEDENTSRAAAIGQAADYEDDEAMARRMQEELYAGGDTAGHVDVDGVRAPISRRTETLVGGPESDWAPADLNAAVLAQMRARQERQGQSSSARLGVFNQAPVASIWDGESAEARRQGLSQATGGASDGSSKAARLAELFRPPFDLMHQVPWDVARDKGKEELKWILVNVQDPSIFDCQQLNRDIWKHDGIKELVKESFIFIQYSKDDPRGSQYIQYYFQTKHNEAAYPHIAIVDPRTGEQVKVWSGRPVPSAGDFYMQLVEFLDRYSLDVTKKNPVAKRKPEKSKSLDVDRLTEEEMLDLALQNSLANNDSTLVPKAEDPDDLTKSFGDAADKGKGKATSGEQTESTNGGNGTSTTISPFSQISATSPHEEPAAGPGVTRIQFRHSNGRVVRRFRTDDTVRRMYEWLRSEPLEGNAGVEFDLKGMGKDLMEHLDETIQDAGLSNATVMVEFIED